MYGFCEFPSSLYDEHLFILLGMQEKENTIILGAADTSEVDTQKQPVIIAEINRNMMIKKVFL